MKRKFGISVALVVLAVALAGCHGRETSLTGGYGSSVVAGQVIMGGVWASGSPAGVEVSVAGTGMMTTLGDDGRFAFAGVPRDAELRFFRGDGISAGLKIEGASSGLVVELDGKGATRSARRRSATQKLEYEGVIRTVSADKLVLYTSHKEEVEITIDPATTVIRKGDQTMTAADLQVDWRVHVKATLKDGAKVASLIIVQNTGDDDADDDGGTTMTANGPVTAVDPLKVLSQSKGEVTVQTDDNTIIKKQGERITVDQIVVGDEINAMGTRVDDTTLLARQIEVRGNSKH